MTPNASGSPKEKITIGDAIAYIQGDTSQRTDYYLLVMVSFLSALIGTVMPKSEIPAYDLGTIAIHLIEAVIISVVIGVIGVIILIQAQKMNKKGRIILKKLITYEYDSERAIKEYLEKEPSRWSLKEIPARARAFMQKYKKPPSV